MINAVKNLITKHRQSSQTNIKINHPLAIELIDKNAIQIIQTLKKNKFKAYLVGGCIRDILLGLKPKDFDISTDARPEQIHKLFKRSRIIGRRFQIVHILFGRRDFIEVSTFRGKEKNKSMLKNDNNFGNIETDAMRRDFTINALYYDITNQHILDWTSGLKDIKNKQINIIGNANLRFNQDPVRMLRAIRFSSKLNFTMSNIVQVAIHNHKALLSNIPSARLFEECLKLFHNKHAYRTYQMLQVFQVLELLFPTINDSSFIKYALRNTSDRIKQNLAVSPAFIFAVFLYDDYLAKFKHNKRFIKSPAIANEQAALESINNQRKIIAMPKFVMSKIKNTWILQHKLEIKNPKQMDKILKQEDFRMAFDFLILRSQSTHPELQKTATFWHKAQK